MALVLNNITVKTNEQTVVKNVSISVAQGKITAILGANGAGKSELVLAVAGMLPVIDGTVFVDGQDITNHRPDQIRQAGVAAVPEGHKVLTKLSVDDNLRAAGSMLSENLQGALKQTYEIFPELAERKTQIAGTLSGGQQQMVAIGHALMSKPKYILLDEMSLGLAPLIVKRLMQITKELAASGTGIILIEQFTGLALEIADFACIMNSGGTHFSGAPALILANPEILNEAYLGG